MMLVPQSILESILSANIWILHLQLTKCPSMHSKEAVTLEWNLVWFKGSAFLTNGVSPLFLGYFKEFLLK